jgi:hypothetical protein
MLFFFLLAASAQQAAGQKGLEKGYYLAKSDSAKIEGYFYLNEYVFGSIDFYPHQGSKTMQVLRPEQVNCIATEDGTVILPAEFAGLEGKRSMFVKQFFTSGVNLYEGRVDKKDVFFINSDKQPDLIKINSTAPQAFLQAYLNDACSPKSSIRYYKSELISAIKKYAQCKGYTITKKAKSPFLLNISLGLRGTYYDQLPRAIGVFPFAFERVKGEIWGGDIRIGLMKNFHLKAGFAQTKITMRQAEANAFQYSYKTYEFPVELTWYVNKNKKLSPLLGAGVNYMRATNPVVEENMIFQNFGTLMAVGNPRRFWQFRGGLAYRIHKKMSLELTARYMKRQEVFFYNGGAVGGYIFVTHRSWFDYSLAVYLPLVTNKPIR